MYILILSLALLPLTALALPWDGPVPTIARREEDRFGNGFSPAPTPGPHGILDPLMAWKRQGTIIYTSSGTRSTYYSYATCGYLSGFTNIPLTCYYMDQSCVVDVSHSAFSCCDSTNCKIATSCVPLTQISSCISASGCVADPYVTKCESEYPYCNRRVLNYRSGLATNWYCGSAPTVRSFDISATDGLSSVATYVKITMSVTAPNPTSSVASATPTAPTATPPSSTSLPPTKTPTPTPDHSPTPNPSPTSSPTPIGAIVGGALGGIALIGVIALLAIVIIRRRRAPSPPAAATTERSDQHPPSHGQHGIAMSPIHASAYSSQQTHNTPTYLPPQEKQVYEPSSQPVRPQFQASVLRTYTPPPFSAPTPIPSPHNNQTAYDQSQPPRQNTIEMANNAVYPAPSSNEPPSTRSQAQSPVDNMQRHEYSGSVGSATAVPLYNPRWSSGRSVGGGVPEDSVQGRVWDSDKAQWQGQAQAQDVSGGHVVRG